VLAGILMCTCSCSSTPSHHLLNLPG
jgi:hypothetical protein